MPKVLEKVERRLGERLFLKGERCAGPKCAQVRKSYPPGAHGRSRRKRRSSTEYTALLKEKQKVRFLYGLDDRDTKRYISRAAQNPGIFSFHFMGLLERRLDNVVFRLGFVPSRRTARHAVSHGHIAVNGKRVNIPSYEVKKGDVVSIKERSLKSGFFQDLGLRLEKYEPPQWLELEKNKKEGKIVGAPDQEGAGVTADLMKVKEFYSR